MRWLVFLLFSVSCSAQSGIDLSSNNPLCTTANPCTLQVYRTTCNGSSQMQGPQCPAFPDPSYIQLANNTTTLAGSSVTGTGTSWTYHDKNGDSTRPDLVHAQVYAYVQTAIFNGDPTRSPSNPSNQLVLPFQLQSGQAPLYPVTGTCVIVK